MKENRNVMKRMKYTLQTLILFVSVSLLLAPSLFVRCVFFPYLFHLFVVPQFKKYICLVYPQFILPFKYYNSNLILL